MRDFTLSTNDPGQCQWSATAAGVCEACRAGATSRRNCEYRDDAWARRPTAVKTMSVTGRARIEGAYMTYVLFRMGVSYSCIAACSFRARNDSQLGHTSRLAGARLLARRTKQNRCSSPLSSPGWPSCPCLVIFRPARLLPRLLKGVKKSAQRWRKHVSEGFVQGWSGSLSRDRKSVQTRRYA